MKGQARLCCRYGCTSERLRKDRYRRTSDNTAETGGSVPAVSEDGELRVTARCLMVEGALSSNQF